MPEVATQITRVTMASDRVITTDTIKVYAVILAYDVAGANDATVFFKTADESDIYFLLTTGSGESQEFHGEWIADKGLSLVSGNTRGNSANAIVTIIHSAVGV